MRTDSTTRVLWIGAGFSHAVTRGATPLTAAFFDRAHQFDLPDLNKALDRLGTRDLVELARRLEQEVHLPISRSRRSRMDVCQDTDAVRRQVEAYAVRRLANAPIFVDHWAVDLLVANSAHTTVITTNYDTITEQILSGICGISHSSPTATCHHCRSHYPLWHECACGSDPGAREDWWRASLIKLHGSIAWRYCSNIDCDQFGCIRPDPTCRALAEPSCCRCSDPQRPVIVTQARDYDTYPRLQRLWDGALDAISSATELVVFCASLSPTDGGLAPLLAQSKSLEMVAIVDPKPKAVAGNIEAIRGGQLPACVELYEMPIDGSRPEWLTELSCEPPC